MMELSIAGGNRRAVIRNIPFLHSPNDGEPKGRDFPSAPLSDNSYPYNWGKHFEYEHNPIRRPSMEVHTVIPQVPNLGSLPTEIEKIIVHTQHLDPSTPFLTPPVVLEFGHSQIDVNKNYRSSTQVSSAHSSGVFIAMGIGIGCLLLLLLIACVAIRKNKKIRPGTVLQTGVVGEGAVQQHAKTDMSPPGQAGPGPASNDLPPPYSECINKPASEEPPPFLTDTELLAHNNHLFETGFTNKCVAMTTAPNTFGDHKTEFVFNNGRIVERLSVNETRHGARRAGERDNVVYVDEHSKAVL